MSIYRPSVVSYRVDGRTRLPDGSRVTKATPGAEPHRSKSPYWWGSWTDPAGTKHRRRLSRSKEAAKRVLAKLQTDSELACAGLTDPYAEHRGRPISEHIDDYRTYLAAQDDTPAHVRQVHSHCTAIAEGIGARVIGDLEPTAVVEFLAGLREPKPLPTYRVQEWYSRAEVVAAVGCQGHRLPQMVRRQGLAEQVRRGDRRHYPHVVVERLREEFGRGLSISTTNHYLVSIKSFSAWLVSPGRRRADDPLKCLQQLNARVDVRRCRRVLTPEDFERLLIATRTGKPFRRLPGPERALLYECAAGTGFRAHELSVLTPTSFDRIRLTVTLPPKVEKARRGVTQPITAGLLKLLTPLLDSRGPKDALWPGTWWQEAADGLQIDLAAAGIPYIDPEGQVYDFHAMRCQYITDLIDAGGSPKVVQTLARHSTIQLTMDTYTKRTERRDEQVRESLDRARPEKPPQDPQPPP